MVQEPDVFDPVRVNWQATTSGISLFRPIPDRNCSIAGIPGKLLQIWFHYTFSFVL